MTSIDPCVGLASNINITVAVNWSVCGLPKPVCPLLFCLDLTGPEQNFWLHYLTYLGSLHQRIERHFEVHIFVVFTSGSMFQEQWSAGPVPLVHRRTLSIVSSQAPSFFIFYMPSNDPAVPCGLGSGLMSSLDPHSSFQSCASLAAFSTPSPSPHDTVNYTPRILCDLSLLHSKCGRAQPEGAYVSPSLDRFPKLRIQPWGSAIHT